VTGDYRFEFISPDWRGDSSLANYSSYYCGASIGEDNTILAVYEDTNALKNETYALGARIFDPEEEKWTFELITSQLSSRFCYPHVFVSEEYFHVVAVEDEYDEDVENEDHPFRFGQIKHFQKKRDSDNWNEKTLINLNDDYEPPEIKEKNLRPTDLHVDSDGIVHVLIKYDTDDTDKTQTYHYMKKESEKEWETEKLTSFGFSWIKIWERKDGKFFYICSNYNGQIFLMRDGSPLRYKISDLSPSERLDPTPFVANTRGGSKPSNRLEIVLFSGSDDLKAISISVDTSAIG